MSITKKSSDTIEVVSGAAHNVTWTFKYDSEHYKKIGCAPLYSDQFWILGNMWKLCFKINSYHIGNSNWVKFADPYLEIVDPCHVVEFSYFIHALGSAKQKALSWASSDCEFTYQGQRGCTDKNVGVDTFFGTREIFQDGKLTLHLQIIPGENFSLALPDCRHPNQLRLLTDEKYTDVTVMVGEKQIKAHKAILAAHSPVFDAMFSSDMQESRQSVIKIDDLDYEVVKEMLTYIYSDNSPNMEKLVNGLLIAADKYDLDRLKALCEQHLCAKVSIDTAVKYQALAALCNAVHLQQRVIRFIQQKISWIMKTDDWTQMVQLYSLSRVWQKEEQNVEDDDNEGNQEGPELEKMKAV